eukprot:CAMPEP_0172302994 /NCGR_PEP_ID=MMETSP1058-20130122/4607_1 /TAXON_ID=83371 /ORGANISM="Detonula confervacea, Strain CCMP 353" /LENGTH=622 /DNA_ID=CAMNT_0013013669 /DNA_START=16 /DNA_END=1884 /DNA_ORIENTATION=-
MDHTIKLNVTMNSATATTIAAGSIDAPADTPPREKNAASQHRSRRKRVSHPFLDSPDHAGASSSSSTTTPSTPPAKAKAGYSTPPRHHMPITPDVRRSPEPPALMNALKEAAMAARPSRPPSTKDGDAELPQASYSSSIEAMAAHVEASHSTKKRNSRKKSTPLKLKKERSRSDSGSGSRSHRKSSTKKAPQAQAGSRKSAPPGPQSKIWLIAIPILLPFLVCETFLWLLVFRFKDAISTGEMVSMGGPDISMDSIFQEDIGEEVREIIEESEIIISGADSVDSPSVEDDDFTQEGETDEEEPQEGETSIEPNGELMRLHSMLEEGFAKLRGSVLESNEESKRKSVESLCGSVWVAANEMLSSESLDSSGASRDGNSELVGSSGEMTLEDFSQSVSSSWKSLALDAQHCLGGAGLAFLTEEDVDSDRLRVSTKVFDRLLYVEPYNPDVRAGLGTSLLIQGIFHHDNSDSTVKEAHDARSLLTLASYHLKVASSLCSSPLSKMVGNGGEDTAPTALSRLTRVDDENAASHAAILHNLALAHLTLGDTDSSVPILLRAAAICREHPIDIKPYWNAPNHVLQAAGERALLIAAKLKKSEPTKKKRRIPFLPFFREDLNVEEMVGI